MAKRKKKRKNTLIVEGSNLKKLPTVVWDKDYYAQTQKTHDLELLLEMTNRYYAALKKYFDPLTRGDQSQETH